MTQFDVLAFIGRFQPFHYGHKAVVDQALTQAKKVVIVIGCHDQPRDTRNPFTTAERVSMITSVYPDEVQTGRIVFIPQIDYRYNDDRWIDSVRSAVTLVANTPFTPDPVNIGLIGHEKDRTSFYLKCFPGWGSVAVEHYKGIDATDIRNSYFANDNSWQDGVPDEVFRQLVEMMDLPLYKRVQEEFGFIANYKKQWEQAPYPPTFQTVDAVVVQSGFVLLVERRAAPGKGLWAIPGGFLDPKERLLDGAIRELVEETKIDVPDQVLRRCITKQQTFDAPNRSQRGRTITTAFLIELRPDTKLPKVKGSDDAAKAKWVPLSEVKRSVLFEDHFDIISELTGAI